MESNKFPNHQGESVSWRPRKALDVFLSKSEGLRTGRTSGAGPFQKLAVSRPRKSWCFFSNMKAGKNPVFQSEGSQAGEMLSWGGSDILFHSGLQFIGQCPPTLEGGGGGRGGNLLYSVDKFKHEFHLNTCSQPTPRIRFDQIAGSPIAQYSWQIKLTITISKVPFTVTEIEL